MPVKLGLTILLPDVRQQAGPIPTKDRRTFYGGGVSLLRWRLSLCQSRGKGMIGRSLRDSDTFAPATNF